VISEESSYAERKIMGSGGGGGGGGALPLLSPIPFSKRARREAKANDTSPPRIHRDEGGISTVQITPAIFTLHRFTSALFLFSAVAAPLRCRP
jgi:hypothetical protein